MKTLVFLSCCMAVCMCSTKQSNTINYKVNQPKIDSIFNCVNIGGEEFLFFYDEFSSEGSEGKIFFENDTLICKINFSYATSMMYVEQEYRFMENRLYKYKQILNYISPDKSGYILEDSVVVEGMHIFINESFSDTLYQKLLKTANRVNPCWKYPKISD